MSDESFEEKVAKLNKAGQENLVKRQADGLNSAG